MSSAKIPSPRLDKCTPLAMMSAASPNKGMSLHNSIDDETFPLPHLRGNGIKAWNGHGPDATLNPDLWYLAGGRGKPPTRNYFEDRRLRCRDAGVTHHYWTSKGSIAGHKGGILWWWKKKKKGGNQSRDQSRDVSQGMVSGETTAPRFGYDETFDNPPSRGHRREMAAAAASTEHRTAGTHRAPSGSAQADGRASRHAPPTTTGRTQPQPHTLPHRPRAPAPQTQRQSRNTAAPPPLPRQSRRSRPATNGANTRRPTEDLGGDGANGGIDLTTIEGYDQQQPPPNPTASTATDASAFTGQGVRVGGSRRDRARVPVHSAEPNAAAPGGRLRNHSTRPPPGRAQQASSSGGRPGASSSEDAQAGSTRGAGRRGHGKGHGHRGGETTETTDVHGAAGRSVYGR